MADIAQSCPACGRTGNCLLVFQVAPGRKVCEACFDKVRAVEADETASLQEGFEK